jgi:hypothetical protein
MLSRSRRRPRDASPYAAGAAPKTSNTQGKESRDRLPHERDESTPAEPPGPHKVMLRAKRDLDAGLVDTDLRNTPGLDARQRTKLLGREARRSRRGEFHNEEE